MKKQLKKWHLLLSLSVGIFIFLLSISGTLLSFGKEIQRSVSPSSWTVPPGQETANVQLLLQRLQAQADHEKIKIVSLYLEVNANLAWQATMSNGEQWNLNPYTGAITDRFQSGDDFYSVVLHFHRWLLINNEPGRRWARHVVSIVASVLIIQTLIGIVLWLIPRKAAMKRLKPKTHKTLVGTFIQWHLTLGVCTAPLLILIAVCGIGFNWPVVGTLVEWSTASVIERPAKHKPVLVGGQQQVSKALRNGQSALPRGQLHRIYWPQKPDQPLSLRFQMPGEFHPFSYVWLDGGSGEVLGVYDARAATTATRIWNFKYKFHIGDFAGLSVRLLWLMLSLLPSFFIISGLWLWWQRLKKAQMKKTIVN